PIRAQFHGACERNEKLHKNKGALAASCVLLGYCTDGQSLSQRNVFTHKCGALLSLVLRAWKAIRLSSFCGSIHAVPPPGAFHAALPSRITVAPPSIIGVPWSSTNGPCGLVARPTASL